MQTHTVHPTRPIDIDDVLVARLRPLDMPVDAVGAIRIGIEAPDGHLYRVIATSSVVEAVSVFETLNDLGLVPRTPRRGDGGRFTRVFQVHG